MNTQTAAREELYKLATLASHTDLQNETTLAQPLAQTLEEAHLSGEEATQLFADSTGYFKQMAGALFYNNPQRTPSQIHTIVTSLLEAMKQGEDFNTNKNMTAQYKLLRELKIYSDTTNYGICTLLYERTEVQPETLHALLLHQIPPATSRLSNRAGRTYRYFPDHTVEYVLHHPNLAEKDVTYFEKNMLRTDIGANLLACAVWADTYKPSVEKLDHILAASLRRPRNLRQPGEVLAELKNTKLWEQYAHLEEKYPYRHTDKVKENPDVGIYQTIIALQMTSLLAETIGVEKISFYENLPIKNQDGTFTDPELLHTGEQLKKMGKKLHDYTYETVGALGQGSMPDLSEFVEAYVAKNVDTQLGPLEQQYGNSLTSQQENDIVKKLTDLFPDIFTPLKLQIEQRLGTEQTVAEKQIDNWKRLSVEEQLATRARIRTEATAPVEENTPNQKRGGRRIHRTFTRRRNPDDGIGPEGP